MIIIVDGPSSRRAAIAGELAARLGVDCRDDHQAINGSRSCVVVGEASLPDSCGGLSVFLYDGQTAAAHSSDFDMCLNSDVLGESGTAELLKQFVVQRLVRCRETSRRV